MDSKNSSTPQKPVSNNLPPLQKSRYFQALKDRLIGGRKDAVVMEDSPAAAAALTAVFIQKTLKKDLLFITGAFKEESLYEDFSCFHNRVLEFPAAEIFAGGQIADSPSLDLLGQRALSLKELSSGKEPSIVLAPLSAVLQKLPALDFWQKNFCELKKGGHIAFNLLLKKLQSMGYKKTAAVCDKGEFAVRGGLIDIFPPAADAPCRLDFFADTIEEIRLFDPASQKSVEKTDKILLSPASELTEIKKCCLADFLKDPILAFDDLYSLEESYLPLQKMLFKNGRKSHPGFFSLQEFLNKTTEQRKFFFLNHRLEELGTVKRAKKTETFFEPVEFEFLDRKFQAQKWLHALENGSALEKDTLQENEKSSLQKFKSFLEQGLKILIFTESDVEEQKIRELLQQNALGSVLKTINFQRGVLSSAIVLKDLQTVLLCYAFFTCKKHIRRKKWRTFAYHTPVSDFHQLHPGDLAVHYHSGIGRYLGIEKHPDYRGRPAEFIILEYARGSKLYVPIAQAYLVSKYIGSHEEKPELSRLSSGKWQKTKNTAQKKIIGYAAELLTLYAQRTFNKDVCLKEDAFETRLFESEFPYAETVDQKLAIEAIKEDLKKTKPMDRLLSGDVGYGKTEVAMRAVFKMAMEGRKQTAILVPTTILALQHWETFRQRFSGYPLKIALLSRFNTPAANKKIVADINAGKTDIVIGTHRLLSSDLAFKDLGLLIIDEEHRFGVRAKEKLKKLKKNIDVLSMSATPIPRTLYMSLIGVRDISQINTPPQDRLPIKTILAESSKELLQNALLKELAREGQAFVLHNRTDTIFKRQEFFQKLLPQAKIMSVHGQMKPEEIENIFHAFKQRKADILITTTIIENGIDIPNANTIIIENASSFGLADLYQLRGRVGRWDRLAYAYLLTPKGKKLSPLAKKRLLSLAEAPGFGGGAKIAMRDLEIRGAGDLLGVKQSGQVSQIGFHLYCKLLKKAVESLKKQKPCSFIEPKLEFAYPAYLPESYIKETSLRMEIYHRLGEAVSFKETDDLKKELIDRFGPLPRQALFLLAISRIKIKAAEHLLTFIKFGSYTVSIEQAKGKAVSRQMFSFPQENQKTPDAIEHFMLDLIQKNYAHKPA